MRNYYMCGFAQDGEYEESFEKIIEAKNKRAAHAKLSKLLCDFETIKVEQIYETTSDAMV